MSDRPMVSIVVPTHDRAGFVETAVLSLLEQDYPALEVIVLDDGSRDETPAVLAAIAEHAEPGRLVWDRHDNIGQAATINEGFARARGALLGYLSSDDYLLPGAISRLVEAAEQHADGDVFYGGFAVVDEADHTLDTILALQHTLVDAVRWAVCMPGVGALMRRSCYERIGGWDPTFHFSPDYEWWVRAGSARFVRIPEVLGMWRSHDGSITMSDLTLENVRVRLEERFRMLDRLYAGDDVPEAVRDVRDEAYAATLIEMGMLLDGGLGSEGRRFDLDDRLGERYSQRSAEGAAKGRLWSDRRAKQFERRVAAQGVVIAELERTVQALRDTLAERDAQVVRRNGEHEQIALELQRLRDEVDRGRQAQAAAQAAAAPVRHESRPRWLRVARQVTPASLRPRVGAAVHRVKGKVRP